MAPAEVLAADPLPDAVAVMQLAVAASAHRAGGVKVCGAGAAEWRAGWLLAGVRASRLVGLQRVLLAGVSSVPRSACLSAVLTGTGACPSPPLPLQLPEGAGRLAVFIDGTEGEADLATLKVGAWCGVRWCGVGRGLAWHAALMPARAWPSSAVRQHQPPAPRSDALLACMAHSHPLTYACVPHPSRAPLTGHGRGDGPAEDGTRPEPRALLAPRV